MVLPISKGSTAQLNTLKKNVIMGAKIKRRTLDLLGKIISLKINFKPSANGCKNPQIPTTLGPLRLCIEAIAFLSKSV